MGFFDANDPFDELFSMLRGGGRTSYNSYTEGQAPLSTVIKEKTAYIVLECSTEDLPETRVHDEIREDDFGTRRKTGNRVLQLLQGEKLLGHYVLPKGISPKKVHTTLKNGILEVSFSR